MLMARILRETGVQARDLELELTESVLMANADFAAERRDLTAELGSRVLRQRTDLNSERLQLLDLLQLRGRRIQFVVHLRQIVVL